MVYMIINKYYFCTAYTDLTGQFPYRSSFGNKYLLVGYHYDANCIIANPLNDMTVTSITKPLTSVHKIFKQEGVSPNTHIVDTEVSQKFIQALEQKRLSINLCHRTYTAGTL